MSDKEWYEGLPASELEGKHVQVTYDEGCVVSGRMVECNGDAVIADGSCDGVGVLWRDGDGLKLDKGVRNFRLVWDERDWKRIEVKDMMPGDVAVVCGRLIWGGVVSGTGSLVATSTIIPLEMVSCVLRCRSKLPTSPGFYRSDSGELLYLADDSGWWLISPDGPSHLSLPFADLMPLTPVHFVDGRAE